MPSTPYNWNQILCMNPESFGVTVITPISIEMGTATC